MSKPNQVMISMPFGIHNNVLRFLLNRDDEKWKRRPPIDPKTEFPGKAELKYDSMSVEQKHGLVTIQFYWQRRPVAYLEVSADLRYGDKVHIEKLKGHVDLELTVT